MTTMVEKVAKAIYDKATTFDGDQIAVHLGHSCIIDMSSRNSDELWENVMGVCLDAARAAIEAMMDPTEAMISAGEGEDIFTANGTLVSCASALTHYEVMIQAALKEGQ